MCARFQPAACRSMISLRPCTVSRALPWDTRTSGRMWALDKPHPTRRFSCVQARPPSPTSWPGTPRRQRRPEDDGHGRLDTGGRADGAAYRVLVDDVAVGHGRVAREDVSELGDRTAVRR